MSSNILSIARKDLMVEARTRQSIGVILLFTLMVVVAVGVTFASTGVTMTTEWSSIFLWIIILFSGSLALSRSFSHEADMHTLEALLIAPIERSDILLGKMVSNFIFMLIVILEAVLLFSAFLGWSLMENIGPVLLICVIGGIGFASLGTTLAGIASRIRARELAVITMIIPLALFTLVLPGIQATIEALSQNTIPWQTMSPIILFSVIYLVIGYLLADHLFDE